MKLKPVLFGAIVGAVVAASVTAWATIPDSNSGAVTACSNKYGAIRLIDAQAGKNCKRTEKKISLQARGATGPPGATGPRGDTGGVVALPQSGVWDVVLTSADDSVFGPDGFHQRQTESRIVFPIGTELTVVSVQLQGDVSACSKDERLLNVTADLFIPYDSDAQYRNPNTYVTPHVSWNGFADNLNDLFPGSSTIAPNPGFPIRSTVTGVEQPLRFRVACGAPGFGGDVHLVVRLEWTSPAPLGTVETNFS